MARDTFTVNWLLLGTGPVVIAGKGRFELWAGAKLPICRCYTRKDPNCSIGMRYFWQNKFLNCQSWYDTGKLLNVLAFLIVINEYFWLQWICYLNTLKDFFLKSLKTFYSDFSDLKIVYSLSEALFKINNLSECVVSQMCWSQRYKQNLHIQLHPQHCLLKPMILKTKLMFVVLRNTLFFY